MMGQPAWVTHVEEVQPYLARADEGPNLFLQATVWNDSMDAERQQGGYYQPLFAEWREELRLGSTGDGGIEAGGCEESQASAALGQARALPDRLMEEVTRTTWQTSASFTTGINKNRNRRIRLVRPVV